MMIVMESRPELGTSWVLATPGVKDLTDSSERSRLIVVLCSAQARPKLGPG